MNTLYKTCLVLSIVGLVLSILNSVLGVYLATKGISLFK